MPLQDSYAITRRISLAYTPPSRHKSKLNCDRSVQAGSLVLPKLRDMRELVYSELPARAEPKIPAYIEAQEYNESQRYQCVTDDK